MNKPSIIFSNEIDFNKFKNFYPLNVRDGYNSSSSDGKITPMELEILKNGDIKLNKSGKKSYEFALKGLDKIENYKDFGYYFMFMGLDSKGKRYLYLTFKGKFITKIQSDYSKFVYFKGSVPRSLSIITQEDLGFSKKNKKPGISEISKRKLVLHFFYNGGESGPLRLDEVDSPDAPVVNIFKLNHDCLMVLTEDKKGIVYGKSYDKFGKFKAVILQDNNIGRDMSKNDKILEAVICHKEFLLIKYSTVYGEEKNEKFYFVVFRISKLAKLLKIHDSQEVDYDRNWDKLLIGIYEVREEEGEEISGLFIKYFTIEENSLYYHLEKLNKYGRFTEVFHKFKIRNLTQSEIKGGISSIKGNPGFDFVKINQSEKIIRVIYDINELFNLENSLEKDLTTDKSNNSNLNNLLEKLMKISDQEIKAEKEAYKPIELLELDLLESEDEDLFEENKDRGFRYRPDNRGSFNYYSNHEKALNDSKVLTPLYTNSQENAKNFSDMIDKTRKNSIGSVFSKEEFEERERDKVRRKSLFKQHEKSIKDRSKGRRGRLTGERNEEKNKRDNACCLLI